LVVRVRKGPLKGEGRSSVQKMERYSGRDRDSDEPTMN